MIESRPLWTLKEIASAVGADSAMDAPVDGISIDSREARPGDLFVALTGANTDGHRFLDQAFESGAAAALVRSDAKLGSRFERPLIRVPDTLEALRMLARRARARFGGKVVAVTGSAGKTGTRDAIYKSLRDYAATHSSIRSFNNHVGVPLSLARMARDCDYAVFEIGMSAPGEIRDLVALVQPHVAVITSIGEAHLGAFGSSAEIAAAKAEIFEGLAEDGTAVINADDEHSAFLTEAAQIAGAGGILSASLENPEADLFAERLAVHGHCNCLTANLGGRRITYRVGIPGRHWALNSLLVLGTVQALGADIGLAVLALARLEAMPGRGARSRIPLADGEFVLIDESYNANPQSVAASLDVIGSQRPEGQGRRIALLGDMDELGAATRDRHRALSPRIERADLAALFAVGPEMRRLAGTLGANIYAPIIEDRRQLLARLKANLRPGDVLLVKGSNSQRMSDFVEALLLWGERNRAASASARIAAE